MLASDKPSGHVRVVVHPWGRVKVDGVPLGVTPMAKSFEVEAGKRTLVVEHGSFEPYTTTIQVPVGGEDSALLLVVDLEKQARATETIVEDQ